MRLCCCNDYARAINRKYYEDVSTGKEWQIEKLLSMHGFFAAMNIKAKYIKKAQKQSHNFNESVQIQTRKIPPIPSPEPNSSIHPHPSIPHFPGTTSLTIPTKPSNPDTGTIPPAAPAPAADPADATATPDEVVAIDTPGMTRTCDPSSIHSTEVTSANVILTSSLGLSSPDVPGTAPETTLLTSVVEERRRIMPESLAWPFESRSREEGAGASPSKRKNSGSEGCDGSGSSPAPASAMQTTRTVVRMLAM